MIRLLLFWSFLLITLTGLSACQKNTVTEVIHYEPRDTIYAHFASNPQDGKKALIKNYGQGIEELLKGVLLSQEKPSEQTLKAFSELLSESYYNATNADLSESENIRYAEIFGTTMGSLGGLREQVVTKRKARFLASLYNYTELDQRWLALFTDIVALAPSYETPEDFIRIARTGNVNEFAEYVIQSNYAKQIEDDLVDEMTNQTVGAAIARFNGYTEQTDRFTVGGHFETQLVSAELSSTR
jgi:hypothetical protein